MVLTKSYFQGPDPQSLANLRCVGSLLSEQQSVVILTMGFVMKQGQSDPNFQCCIMCNALSDPITKIEPNQKNAHTIFVPPL